MANPLTGDFEAVLQVSGATVNRLMASIHQNGGAKTTLPGFTHGTTIRVGDPNPIDGMRGTMAMQVAAPSIELVHGATDRFWLEVAVRARYKPDPGTTPVPEFIHGTVRAQYRIDNIDPTCWGWEKKAVEYLWIRVIGDTVSFTGTAEDDTNEFAVLGAAVDPAVADARITRLATVMLRTRFEATPHKVSRRFRRGSMRSLHVGANRSVVAVPIGLTIDPPAGRIDSINQDLLDGRHFGIGINRDVIIAKIQEQLDAIRASFQFGIRFHHRTYIDAGPFGDVDVVEITIDWTIKLTAASAQWIGGMLPIIGFPLPGGLIAITLSGQARTQKSMFNWDFDVTQFVLLTFDAPNQQFVASPFGSATVGVHGTFAAVIEPFAKPEIQKQVAAAVQGAASGVAGQLNLKTRKDELVKQLKTIDDQADAWFDEAVFTPDGVIVRGHITLSARRAPVLSFAKTAEEDGYSAFESWIPGGRIDSFGWSWSWFNNAGDPGSDTRSDRYVLRRPGASIRRGRFGALMDLHRPLPGLDGMGQICLVLRGVQVHPVTGDLIPVSTARKCTRFGFGITLTAVGRVFLREWVPGPRDPIGPVEEVAIHEVGGAPHSQAVNTLVVRVGDQWSREIAMTLREGLAASRRIDAALVVLVLFKDGTLMRTGSELMTEFRALAAELEAPLVVNEDVRGSWSKALFMDREGYGGGELEWRLVSPTGGVTWAHSGRADAREIGSALDDYLFRGPVPEIPAISPGLEPGTRLTTLALDSGAIHQLIELDSPCPPPPLGRFGSEGVVAFAHPHSAASDAALRKLAQELGGTETETFAVVVYDGARLEEIEQLKASLPDGVVAIPDPDGTIARRFGVRVWPSKVSINEFGMVTGFEMGADTSVRPPRSGEAS